MSRPALVASPVWGLGPTEKHAHLQAEAGEGRRGWAGVSGAPRDTMGADVQVRVTADGHRSECASFAVWDSAALLLEGSGSFRVCEQVPRRVR